MSDADLRSRLEDAEVPDGAEARERAWDAVDAAFTAREPARRGRFGRGRRGVFGGRPAVALAFALTFVTFAAVAAASTPPGAAVRSFVGRVRGGVEPPAPRARLGPLPAGRMLVTSARGAWVVERDGSRRLLGPYAGATWSPRGLYVAAWRGDELRAVAPDGRVAWGLRVPGRVSDARWSPDGFRIAYRRGPGLGVVAGDGTGGRPLAARVRPAAPAWRPSAPHTLAWVAADGRVVVRDVDGGAVVWRSPSPVGLSARELSWSADGRLLLLRGAGSLSLADVPRGRVSGIRLPAGERAVAAAWAPRGRRLAVVARHPERELSRVLVAPASPGPLPDRPVFTTSGRLGAPAWSPDGAQVLVRWAEADEWLLLGTVPGAARRLVAIAAVARRFGGRRSCEGGAARSSRRPARASFVALASADGGAEGVRERALVLCRRRGHRPARPAAIARRGPRSRRHTSGTRPTARRAASARGSGAVRTLNWCNSAVRCDASPVMVGACATWAGYLTT